MKRILFSVFLILNAFLASSQNSIKVEAPNVVARDEQFNVTFIMEGDDSPSEFEWNYGADFQLVWGPQQGRSTSIRVINGKRTRSSQFTYTYVMLPKATGTFTLPAATAKVKNKDISSGTFSIEVVSDASSSTGAAEEKSQATAPGTIADDDLFMRLSLSRTNVVMGEPIIATLKLYQRANITSIEDARFPSFNGFWSQELEMPSNIEFKRESLNDKIYNAAVIRKYMLIPQQSGTIEIEPAELVCLVSIRVSSGGASSIFDGFFDDYRTIRKRVSTPALKVNVAALPSGAPASFGGGVGKFKMTAALNTDSLSVHEAASLVIKISGNGNISLLNAPKVKFPADMEVYDTKISENLDKSTGKTSGTKTYEFPFIPRSHGDFTIEPVKYSYYDTDERKYVTLETSPIHYKVKKGKDSGNGSSQMFVGTPGVNRKDVKNLNEDIRYIKTELPELASKGTFMVGSVVFWLLLAAIVAVSAILWAVLKRIENKRADVAGRRTRKASKMALRRLKQAKEYLGRNLYTAFYEELHKALAGFILDKLNMSLSETSKDTIVELLENNGVGKDVADSFIDILNECEYARYSPDAGHDAMEAHYEKAVNVISSIDSMMKPGKKDMKKVVMILFFVFGLAPLASAAADTYTDSLWTAATAAYSDGRWKDAIRSYEAIDAAGLESPDLYCNIANSYFKDSNFPKAILFYERALKLDPSYHDAVYNLKVASSFIQDKIDAVPEFILKRWMRDFCYLLDSNSWAVIFLILASCFSAMLLLFLLARNSAGKKAGFAISIVFLIAAVFALSFSIWQKKDYMKSDSAIVMVPVTSVKSSPSDESSKDLFILHEGTKVHVLDQVGDWNNIELADGRRGWIRIGDMEII